jgi:hypothetical protein
MGLEKGCDQKITREHAEEQQEKHPGKLSPRFKMHAANSQL